MTILAILQDALDKLPISVKDFQDACARASVEFPEDYDPPAEWSEVYETLPEEK